MPAKGSPSPPLISIFLLSATALCYEVLLVRLFSIIHWHHFAFMIISLALLGYGMSGSFITLLRGPLLRHFDRAFIGNALLFGLSLPLCLITVQRLPFNTLEILWDPNQWGQLLLSYLLLSLPFFFVANAIALSFIRFDRQIARIYGVDLFAAGLGALSMVALLQTLTPEVILRLLILAAFIAVLLFPGFGKRGLLPYLWPLAGMLLALLIPNSLLAPRISDFKGLPQLLQMKDTSVLHTDYSALARTDVVASSLIPLRHAPGLSLQSPTGPPEQLAVFRDGDEMHVIDRITDDTDLAYHDYLSSALPYHLHPQAQSALILNASGGAGVLQAVYFGIAKIDAVESDSRLSALYTRDFADFSRWKLPGDRIRFHAVSPRGFVAATDQQFDLILLGPPGASAGGAAGVDALSETFDLTVEALQAYLHRLNSNGLLGITLWTGNPPRANLKLLVTAVKALGRNGITQPRMHLAWIRSWNTATLVVSRAPLSSSQMQTAREFSRERGFDLNWLPDLKAHETNRFQLLTEPVFYRTARSLFDVPTRDFIDSYKFNIDAATDDRPYFNFHFQWSSLPELLSLPARGGLSLIGVGYPTLLITLVQAVIVAIVLVLLPLALLRRRAASDFTRRSRVVVYFLAIGLAFLFIEIVFIQRFTLILSQPIYAVAVTLCAFLVFSGMGSLYVQHAMRDAAANAGALLARSVSMITLIAALYLWLLPHIGDLVMAQAEPLRIMAALLLAAPLAFFMGMPLPLGLARLQQQAPAMIPWAWGINGCASVLSAVLAVLLAVHVGFNGVLGIAIGLYLLAWWSGGQPQSM